MKRWFRTMSVAALLAASTAMPALAQIGTAITYQGRLELAGAVVNSTVDLQFRLFTSPTGSTQVGTTQNFSNMPLTDGLFTVPLDFGAGAFNGEARHLEIAVRAPAGTGNFVILTPRQSLTAAPYALKVPGVDGHSLDAADGSPTDALFVNSGGDVGIGTTSPLGRLDVRSGNNSYVRVDNVNGDLHMNGGTDKVAGVYNDSAGVDARMDFIVNGGAHMVVNGGGGVGVGTVNPLRRFTVVDGGIFTARFENTHPIGSVVEFSNTTAGTTWELGVSGVQPPAGTLPGSMYFYRQGSTELAMTIAPNSWVGLGISDPGFRLDLPNIANADGRGRANAWTTYSSIRWKDNVKTLENALDTVKQLRGVSFDWNEDHGGAHDIGFVAEEVGKVLPELVTWEQDGQWAKSLAYDRITAVAIEAIKEQQAQIESLRQANAGLEARVQDLLQRVEAIEAAAAR